MPGKMAPGMMPTRKPPLLAGSAEAESPDGSPRAGSFLGYVAAAPATVREVRCRPGTPCENPTTFRRPPPVTAACTGLKVRRCVWLQVHLWLGLVLGLWIAIIDVTERLHVLQGRVGEVSRFVDRRCIVIDQYSGAVSFVKGVASGHGGQTFAAWQWSLHSGQVFGTVWRILVLLTGLACAVLFITGTIRWLQKRAAQRAEHARRAIAQPRTAIE